MSPLPPSTSQHGGVPDPAPPTLEERLAGLSAEDVLAEVRADLRKAIDHTAAKADVDRLTELQTKLTIYGAKLAGAAGHTATTRSKREER